MPNEIDFIVKPSIMLPTAMKTIYSELMTENQWDDFKALREDFKLHVENWKTALEKIDTNVEKSFSQLQKELAKADGVPEYPLENTVVYNTAFDDITAGSTIKLIVIGDNPGKSEQLNKNRTYLIGQSGKIAEGFFRNNPELGIDFRNNVLILNKTPVHTAKTKELVQLCKQAGENTADIVAESQKYMAELAFRLQQLFSCEIWIVGYGELKPKGIFTGYRDCLYGLYAGNAASGSDNAECAKAMHEFQESVFVFQHFSMNRFTIDLREKSKPELLLSENLHTVGTLHRQEIFGI